MSWIKEIKYPESTGELKRIYDRIKGPDDYLDNIITVHSLRPHTLEGHLSLYKNVIHHTSNTLPKWYIESIGVYVSFLNNCNYCVQHHFEGLKKLIGDNAKSDLMFDCIKHNNLDVMFDEKMCEGLHYANKLTLHINTINQSDVLKLQKAGFTDGEILEINQITSYFNFANRTVIGLGVNLDGDVLGTNPNNLL